MVRNSVFLVLGTFNAILILSLRWALQEGHLSTHAKAGPIHLAITASSDLGGNIGLFALINSTLSTSRDPAGIIFHVITTDATEGAVIKEFLRERFGPSFMKNYAQHSIAMTSEYEATPISQAKYILPMILPKVDRVLYLAQSVIVQHDISQLFSIDLEGFPIAVATVTQVPSYFFLFFCTATEADRNVGQWKEIKLSGFASYDFENETCWLNDDVIVYDLKGWRASSNFYTDTLIHFDAHEYSNLDGASLTQVAFNLAFYRRYKVLDPLFNLMSLALPPRTDLNLSTVHILSHQQVHSAVVLNWDGAFKPWMCDGEGYYSERWTIYFPDYSIFLASSPLPSLCSDLILTSLPASSHEEKFTVVIVSFARIDTLLRIVRHLQKSAYLKEILIAWNNQEVRHLIPLSPSPTIQALIHLPPSSCPVGLLSLPWVRCIQQKENLVHNRFLIWSEVTTQAVMHHDDDVRSFFFSLCLGNECIGRNPLTRVSSQIMVPIAELDAAFQIWRRNRDQLVGFEPRVTYCQSDAEDTQIFNKSLSNPCRYQFWLTQGYFEIVIGKLFIVHRDYMEAYFTYPDLVDLSTNLACEDIAMSFLVAQHPSPPPRSSIDSSVPSSVSPRPPILFTSHLRELSSSLYSGLSVNPGWTVVRNMCVERLTLIFEGQRPGKGTSFYHLDETRQSVIKMNVAQHLPHGWCSGRDGSLPCPVNFF